MRPLELSIEGWRSFRRRVDIDFTDRTQFAIIGDTGAGKTSILEAMTYALYGRTTSGASGQQVMNDVAQEMRVAFRFQLQGDDWRVTRASRRTKAGEVKAKGVILERLSEGAVVESVEQARPVNERIENLVGLNRDAFMRAVVLPQGGFARLLVEDKPKERGEILNQVWRDEAMACAVPLVQEASDRIQALALRARERIAQYPDDPQEHLAQLEKALERVKAEAEPIVKLASAAEDAFRRLMEAEKDLKAAKRNADRLEEISFSNLLDRLDSILEGAREWEQRLKAIDDVEHDLKARLEEVPADDDGPSVTEVAESLTRLDHLSDALGELYGKLDEAEEVADREVESAAAAEAAANEQKAAQVRHDEHQSVRGRLWEARDLARARVEKVTKGCDEYEDRLKELTAARKARDGLASQVGQLEEHERSAARELDSASDALTEARAQRDRAAREDSVATAVQGLGPGDDCPVCGGVLGESWVSPQSSDLDEAMERVTIAQSRFDEASHASTKLKVDLEKAREMFEEGRRSVAEAEASFFAAMESLADLSDDWQPEPDSDLAPTRDLLLVKPLQAQKVAEDEVHAWEKGDEDVKAALTEASDAWQRRETDAREARTEATRLRREIHTLSSAVDRSCSALHKAYRPDLMSADRPRPSNETRVEIERCVANARARKKVLDLRSGQRTELQHKLAKTAADRTEYAERRHEEVVVPENDLRTVAAGEAGTLRTITESIGCSVAARSLEGLSGQELRSIMLTLEDDVTQAREAAQTEKERAIRSAREYREEISGIAGELDSAAETDPSDPQSILQCAKSLAEEARHKVRDSSKSVERFRRKIDSIVRLQEFGTDIEERARVLGDLRAALNAGRFPKWLALRRSRTLLVHASRILNDVSGGQYRFADPGPEEKDDTWKILDQVSGLARSPASLSGGEQFIASLSLALGMVEMMARGGGRLDSIFLDEGFGTLDRRNLDAALEALGVVAKSGKTVGVISHVRAVAEQIQDVLSVSRTEHGSCADWLTPKEKETMALSDAGAGLLE